MQDLSYTGQELEMFQHATVWKKYFASFLKPYLSGTVLEVGAGMGGTTVFLCDGTQKEWICLEPDPDLFNRLDEKNQTKLLPSCCRIIKGTTKDLPAEKKFNAILYIDVIEHIQNDQEELKRAINLLTDNGFLIILVPAHQHVYSSFDKSIGHYRRYNKRSLKLAIPEGMKEVKIFYLDSIGLLTSVANKYVLKQDYPTRKQIDFWDKTLVRLSKFSDFLIRYKTGKSLIGIWQKPV